MRRLLVFSILALSLTAQGRPESGCEWVFGDAPLEFMEKMHVLQVGDFRRYQFHEEQIGELISMPVRDRRCAYRYTCGWFLPSTLKNIIPPHGAEMEMTAINRREFYGAVYGKYGDHFDTDLIERLVQTDDALEMERTKYAEIRSLRGLLGTYRWFTAKAGWRDHENDTMVDLPYVRIGRIRGAPDLKVTEFLNRIGREKDIGIVEIGKFANLADTPELRERTAEMIEMAWLRDSKPDDIYIAHVTTLARARLFKKKYGFEIAETFKVPGNPHPEAILWVRGHQFQASLRKLLNVWVEHSNDRWVKIEPILPGETHPAER